jgi:hypothetical protein
MTGEYEGDADSKKTHFMVLIEEREWIEMGSDENMLLED